jgi:F-type H+-transporting ATPase subunit epsilon
MTLKVELVSPTARVWSGEAQSVSTRTIEGDIGILTDHTPLFAVLVDGKVVIHGTNGEATQSSTSLVVFYQLQTTEYQSLRSQLTKT